MSMSLTWAHARCTVPGSQNGFDNSGHTGGIEWPNDSDNVARTKYAFTRLINTFNSHDWYRTVTAFEAVNEPQGHNSAVLNLLRNDYYPWSMGAIKDKTKKRLLAFHDAFLGPSKLDGRTLVYTAYLTASLPLLSLQITGATTSATRTRPEPFWIPTSISSTAITSEMPMTGRESDRSVRFATRSSNQKTRTTSPSWASAPARRQKATTARVETSLRATSTCLRAVANIRKNTATSWHSTSVCNNTSSKLPVTVGSSGHGITRAPPTGPTNPVSSGAGFPRTAMSSTTTHWVTILVGSLVYDWGMLIVLCQCSFRQNLSRQ